MVKNRGNNEGRRIYNKNYQGVPLEDSGRFSARLRSRFGLYIPAVEKPPGFVKTTTPHCRSGWYLLSPLTQVASVASGVQVKEYTESGGFWGMLVNKA
jgi:hypothetical protein